MSVEKKIDQEEIKPQQTVNIWINDPKILIIDITHRQTREKPRWIWHEKIWVHLNLWAEKQENAEENAEEKQKEKAEEKQKKEEREEKEKQEEKDKYFLNNYS